MSITRRRPCPLAGAIVLVLAGHFASARADLVAHYRLDEASGTTVVDSAGANDGTLINSANVTQNEIGEFGHAYKLSGGGGVNLGTSSAVQPSDNFTITFWFKADTLDQFDRLIESMNGTVSTSTGLRIDLGSSPGDSVRVLLRDGSGSSDSFTNPTTLSVGEWNFVALRFDKDGPVQLTVIPYSGPLSGSVVGTQTATKATSSLSASGVLYESGRPTVLGVETSAGPASNALDGLMDDVAFYNTVLTDDEVKFVGRFGAQTAIPVLAWDGADPGASPTTAWASNLDAAGAISWNASSLNHVTGIDTNTRLTEAFQYDGTGTAVASGFLPNRSANMTVELWVKPDDLASGDQEILFEAGGDGNGMSLLLDGDQLRFRMDQDSVLSGTDHLETSTTLDTSLLGDFFQVVGIVDLTNDQIELFLNGQSVGLDTTAANVTSWAGGNADALGSANASGINVGGTDSGDLDGFGTFEGLIGAVRLYNSALGAEQILANYQAMFTVPEPTGLLPALVGCLGCYFMVRRRRRAG